MHTFHPNIILRDKFALDCSGQNSIKNEPMFFNSSIEFVYENCGNITRSFIDALPLYWDHKDLVFDSRVHMLMPGWYPAIPGWHHDDIPRSGKMNQPNYEDIPYLSEHIIGIVGDNISNTELLIEPIQLPDVTGKMIYKEWDAIINSKKRKTDNIQSNRLTQIDCFTFHRALPAISNGFRWFGRVSRNTDRINKITNEIRINANVYMPCINQGW